MRSDFVFALVLSGMASAATVVGSLLGMAVRRPGKRFMAFSLGFSAGVMMFVSFGELLWSGIEELGFQWGVIGFLGGMLLMFGIDLLVPHEFVGEHRGAARGVCDIESSALLRTGLMVALGIGIHNLPEGMATFAGALKSRGLGIAIAVAIALHNIPEGLAVTVPVFCATGSRRKALGWSALSGGAELVGALLAAAVLLPLLTPTFLAWVLAVVAGLMVFVSFDELIPASYAHGHQHASVAGMISGMALMAASIRALR